MTTEDQVHPKGRDASEVRTYHQRFESDYKIGDVVLVNDAETGRKRPGSFTLMGQFQTGDYDGWWTVNKTKGGESYREESKPVLDIHIREWVEFNSKVVQPRRIEVDCS